MTDHTDLRAIAEADRLAALRGLGLLDSSPTEAFDRVTRLAAHALGAPMVLVSLVDENRQWFKSKYGIDSSETPRSVSFCTHAVEERRPLIVPDAERDARFRNNPLVTGAPHIRSYAGIPLYTLTGHAIGTLCAIDSRRRDYDDNELNMLRDFALVIEDLVHALERPQSEPKSAAAGDRDGALRACFEHAGLGMMQASLSGYLLRTNVRMRALLGYSETELTRMTFADITHPEDVAKASEMFQQIVAGTIDRYHLQKRYLRKDGSSFWSQLSLSLKRSGSGQPEFVMAAVDDISARKHAESELLRSRDTLQCELADQSRKLVDSNDAMRRHVKQLLESQHVARRVDDRLRTIADSVPMLVAYWNREQRCEFANEACCRWFGSPPEAMIGRTLREVQGENSFAEVRHYAERALDGTPQRFERALLKRDGATLYVDVRYVPDVGADGAVLGFTSTVSDVSTSHNVQMALEAANAKLANDTAADHLTGLVNRRTFDDRCAAALDVLRQGGERFGLIVLNLDEFRRVNETYGHAVGDDVLRMVGKLLKRQLRSHRDSACRLSGADFALLVFGEYDQELMAQMADSIRTALRLEAIASERGAVRVQATFGIAISDAADADHRAIQARADNALYDAKKVGRERAPVAHAQVVGG